jgi:hypothetical protein
MLSRKRARRLRIRLALQSLAQRSEYNIFPGCERAAHRLLSIPHAATPPAGQQLSSSPTNGVMSPVKESSLHHSDSEEDAKTEAPAVAPAEPTADPFDEAASTAIQTE